MVVVRHEKEHNGQTYYNLYVSDITGVKYSLSLENILSDKTSIWGRNTTLVDIHRVIKSLNMITHQIYNLLGGEQGWHSDERTCLSPLWSKFNSWTWPHMWVEFVVGSQPCSTGFYLGSQVFIPPQKKKRINMPNSNLVWNQ